MNSKLPARASRLRRDLQTVVVDSPVRSLCVIADEISGRFTRVSERNWARLTRGEPDPSLWAEAEAAGWTRRRGRPPHVAFRPWCVRLPLGSIGRIAESLARRTGWLFAGPAVAGWASVMVVAGSLTATRGDELAASLGSLDAFLRQSHPLWLLAVFVVTKLLHELAHAVVCHRVGARPGEVGLLFLFGMPCPYCDVTDVYRQRSAMRRAAVMAAGIYVEWILASVAALVWYAADGAAVELAALHVMLVCGVSTLMFNANPLMRYDGYYLASDLVGSVNLRRDAADAFRAVLMRPLAGRGYPAASRRDRRALLLTVYHVASGVYRALVLAAMATLVVAVARRWELAGPAKGLVIVCGGLLVAHAFRRATGVLFGGGFWRRVPGRRRLLIVGGVAIAVLLVTFTPTPRYRRVWGRIDVEGARRVVMPSGGVVESVAADFGTRVEAGEVLVRLREPDVDAEVLRLEGELRGARLRSQLARRRDGDLAASSATWKTLEAAERAIETRLAEARLRADGRVVRAPARGTVVPAGDAGPNVGKTAPSPDHLATARRNDATRPEAVRGDSSAPSLEDRAGRVVAKRGTWCQVCDRENLAAVLLLDAVDRPRIEVGSPVSVRLATAPGRVIRTSVRSVSPIAPDEKSIVRRAAYRVLCGLPDEISTDLLTQLGSDCEAVFRLPARSLAAELKEELDEWFRE